MSRGSINWANARLESCLFRNPLVGNLKGKAEEFDRSVHVRCLPQINTDPATVEKDVVGFGATTCNQLIADCLRKRNVYQAVAMHVADFSSPQAVFCASKAVRLGRNPRPALQSGIDSLFRSRDSHSLLARDHHLDVNRQMTVTNSRDADRRCGGRACAVGLQGAGQSSSSLPAYSLLCIIV